ncbi:MAG TPA: hypothetical protein VJ400_00095 [Thermoplasmata archaeon]|nr:hypothetical protein [Thermoplasmata archaeon]
MPFWDKKKPEVAPVAKGLVLDRLLALNNPSNPFEIRQSQETDLYIERRTIRERTDAQYRAWLLLDETTKEGRFCEEMTKKETETGARLGTRGVGLSFGSTKTWSRLPGIYDGPIRDTLEANGWTFKQVLRKSSATYPR